MSLTELALSIFWEKNPLNALSWSFDHLKLLLSLGLRVPDQLLSSSTCPAFCASLLVASFLKIYHCVAAWSSLICKSLVTSSKTLLLYNNTCIDPMSQNWMEGAFYTVTWDMALCENPRPTYKIRGPQWSLGVSLCRGQRSMLGIFFHHSPLYLWDIVSPCSWSLEIWLDHLSRKPQISTCLCIPSVGIIGSLLYPAFYVSSGGSKSGSCISMASTLATDHSCVS